MKYAHRNGTIIEKNGGQDRFLSFLYRRKLGMMLLLQVVKPKYSIFMGRLLNHSISKVMIWPFILINKIDMTEYKKCKYKSFNDFFTREIKPEKRKIDFNPKHFISPCDSRLSVYCIDESSNFIIKNTSYTLESLLRDKNLADRYKGGVLLVFRLTVGDYHRYCYIDNGYKTKNYRIKGVLHTVNPIVNDKVKIYKENTREFAILHSENFGSLLIMEVGALLVGKIVNYHEEKFVKRGEEKGKFEFGGSTIIVCIEKDKVIIDEDILKNSALGIETIVKMGEKIGIANKL
ncbi:phosphatidylserine decarboxylase [Lutispora thermophila]|uniref:Phosphatidylserine decarboxylase n=1 Tax=Lutispora thermophila DSM 19022 TaxID=1122184 RepID=A0A1M6ITG1_9FIRM|nr:phosphatidylserine decarboxylase [Lutispora thermophila]SHJ37760.1 phosphatidylserine decarboxylase [Lutispora thermophila DSM 19022]